MSTFLLFLNNELNRLNNNNNNNNNNNDDDNNFSPNTSSFREIIVENSKVNKECTGSLTV